MPGAIPRDAPRPARSLSWPSPKRAVGLGVVLIAGAAILFLPPIYTALGTDTVTLIYNIAQMIVAVILVTLAISVWWSSSRGELLKTISGSLASGLLLWALGQAVYAYYQVAQGPDFVGPTLADAFWLAGYVPIVMGLVLRLRTFAVAPVTARWWAVIAANIVLAALVSNFVVGPILEHPNPEQPLMAIINLAYIAGDVVVVLTASLIMQSLSRGAMSMPWALIAAGCLMFSSSDILFAYGTWSDTFSPAGVPVLTPIAYAYNLLFFSAYVTAAAGTYWLAVLHGVI